MKSIIKNYPITIIIILVSASIFILHIFHGEYGNYEQESINAFGGLNRAFINNGEVWRLFTYSFGHMSAVHFMINAPIFIAVSLPIEKRFGSIRFLLLFIIITGMAGVSIFYFYTGPYGALAGLSGTGYGFAGILTIYILKQPQAFSQSYRLFIVLLLAFGVYSIFNDSAGIANSGHIGGFIAGIILAIMALIFQPKKIYLK